MNKQVFKILFVCSTFERGKDGVGDYVYRLVLSLTEKGYDCTIIAVADKFIKEIEITALIGDKIKIYRYPYSLGIKKNLIHFYSITKSVRFDLMSFHYVPHGYNKKGLTFSLLFSLKLIPLPSKVHLMIHEIWLLDITKFKNKLISIVQKQILKGLVKILNPTFVHTNNQVYQNLLLNNKIASNVLPLFSNFQILEKSYRPKIRENNTLIFLFFGSIYSSFDFNNVINKLNDLKKSLNICIKLIFCGKIGINGQNFFKFSNTKGFLTEKIDFVDSTRICELIEIADFGIVTTSLPLIEKSGVYALFRDYGLPTIIIADPWRPIGYKEKHNDMVIEIADKELLQFVKNSKKKSPVDMIDITTNQFIFDNKI